MAVAARNAGNDARIPATSKPGMRVDIRVEGKGARITPAPPRNTAKLSEIQAILKYSGPRVPIDDMRVTDYKG
jgi:hypothetical protein